MSRKSLLLNDREMPYVNELVFPLLLFDQRNLFPQLVDVDQGRHLPEEATHKSYS